MSFSYLAYGLALRAQFPLPGMRERSASGLPELRIELLDADTLTERWDAATATPSWRGRLGDGRALRIERGAAGDRLFSYGDRARFHLDPGASVLACAPASAGLDWQRTLLSKVLPAVSVMRGYEGLHAAALDTPQGAVAILAPSGMGKSTLALALLARGWPLLADDVAVLSTGAQGVLAHPGTPHMNVAASARPDHEVAEHLGVLAGEHWVGARTFARSPRRLTALFLLERDSTLTLDVRRLSAGPLPLAPYMLGVEADRQLRESRFELFAALAATARLFRITCGRGGTPAELARLVEIALDARGRVGPTASRRSTRAVPA
jgi:hypothetical protein